MFRTRLNPRSGKRERLVVDGVAQFTKANYTIDASADGKISARNAEGAILQVTGGDSIYYTTDGSTPSASVGFLATAGDFIFLDTYQKIVNFKAIKVATATSIEGQFQFGG
jgi:hypothetical protein